MGCDSVVAIVQVGYGFVAGHGGNGSRRSQLQAQLAGKARLGSDLENQSALTLD